MQKSPFHINERKKGSIQLKELTGRIYPSLTNKIEHEEDFISIFSTIIYISLPSVETELHKHRKATTKTIT